MIEIIQEYWKSLLWTDGYRFTGVAITLWLLISSVVMGGLLAVILAVGRVSSNKFIRFPSGCSRIFFAAHRCTYSYWCSIRGCIRWR